MRRVANVWPKVIDFGNLLLAYQKARKGKSHSSEVSQFGLNLEFELLQLKTQLQTGEYEPGRYRLFTIYERKPRVIAAAPFKDRVVQHAVMNVLAPLLDKRLIDDCYACRKGKGVHVAVDRYQSWARRYPYVLKMDIQQYFPSIDRDILKKCLARHIKDNCLLALLGRIIDFAPGDKQGMPIGNLTSQCFANLYLNDFDHFVKEHLQVRAYLRYVDDMIFLGDDKKYLRALSQEVGECLSQLNLQVHPRKQHIMRTAYGVDMLGYRVFPNKRLLRNDNGHRFARKLRRMANLYAQGAIGLNNIDASLQSWIGHAQHADTLGLRRKIISSIIFTRDQGVVNPRAAGRLLEQ